MAPFLVFSSFAGVKWSTAGDHIKVTWLNGKTCGELESLWLVGGNLCEVQNIEEKYYLWNCKEKGNRLLKQQPVNNKFRHPRPYNSSPSAFVDGCPTPRSR